MAGRKLTRQQRWRVEKIQAERNRRAERREETTQSGLEHDMFGHEREGRVIAHFGRTLEVEEILEDGTPGERYRCHQRANLEALVTGDRVSWREGEAHTGVVVGRFDRHSTLERPDMRGQLKPVAANIDRIFIVFAAEPVPHANLIDRYLIAAETTGITPSLVINKVDLPTGDALAALKQRYARLGYEIIEASVKQAHGLDTLQLALKDRTTVFVGQSGVGKSSLIGTLLPEEELRIGALSEDTRKGTHTTTTARLYHFPAGGHLIDSPGIREFGLGHLDARQVADGFIEFRDHLGRCRFRDCAHQGEPGCALKDAVAQGEIDPARFESFQRILKSLNENG